ncbi:hypothetical protein V1291_003527 [Nitrobacteraceae bacterium AZCC 1564]
MQRFRFGIAAIPVLWSRGRILQLCSRKAARRTSPPSVQPCKKAIPLSGAEPLNVFFRSVDRSVFFGVRIRVTPIGMDVEFENWDVISSGLLLKS